MEINQQVNLTSNKPRVISTIWGNYTFYSLIFLFSYKLQISTRLKVEFSMANELNRINLWAEKWVFNAWGFSYEFSYEFSTSSVTSSVEVVPLDNLCWRMYVFTVWFNKRGFHAEISFAMQTVQTFHNGKTIVILCNLKTVGKLFVSIDLLVLQ